MKMSEILATKGIEAENQYYNEPALNGRCRRGVIRKEMRIYGPTTWTDSVYSIVGVEIDTESKSIRVDFLKGAMPMAENLFLALLADRDVRRLIKEYQELGRWQGQKYRVWSTTGMSGREDIFLTTGRTVGGFAITRTIKLCHISQFGKLNEGFGDKDSSMYVGDFVELAVYMGLTDDMSVKGLRKRAGGVKYLKPKFAEEIADFKEEVSKIL